jgi:hypothetical protein
MGRGNEAGTGNGKKADEGGRESSGHSLIEPLTETELAETLLLRGGLGSRAGTDARRVSRSGGVAVLAETLRITSGQSAPFGGGGDFFEVAVDAGGCVSIVLADVCGNGPAAAAFVPELRDVARAALARGRSPGVVLAALNHWLASGERAPDQFATALALRIDPRSGRMDIASAGHLGPFVKSPCGAVHGLLLAGGVALGIWPGQCYAEIAVRLAPGDGLILVTDGVTDALASADDTLGQLGLIDRLRRATPGDGNAICATLLRHAQAGEDATVIVLERGWSPVAGDRSIQGRIAAAALATDGRPKLTAN